jgi:hypothetical protein
VARIKRNHARVGRAPVHGNGEALAEHPRLGLIRLNNAEALLVDLLNKM